MIASCTPRNAAIEVAPERLAGNSTLTESEKITEASRQFEAILLRQILEETQKTVISSKFSDNSTAGGIYRDMVTNQLADSISKSGSFGLAGIFERQLTHPSDKPQQATEAKPSAGASDPITPDQLF
jgi:peptidoglycan hydrolase FlgJ